MTEIDQADVTGGFPVAVEKWSPDEARRWKSIALAIFAERCAHRSRLEVDNCGKCQLTHGDDDGPNYAGWARLYIEAGRAIPEKWRAAFQRELDSDNKSYANALRRSIATFGEPEFAKIRDVTTRSGKIPVRTSNR